MLELSYAAMEDAKDTKFRVIDITRDKWLEDLTEVSPPRLWSGTVSQPLVLCNLPPTPNGKGKGGQTDDVTSAVPKTDLGTSIEATPSKQQQGSPKEEEESADAAMTRTPPPSGATQGIETSAITPPSGYSRK